MACRVGITTDPEERKRRWQRQHPNLYNWEILGTHSTKAAAQAHENRAARASRCVSAPVALMLMVCGQYIASTTST